MLPRCPPLITENQTTLILDVCPSRNARTPLSPVRRSGRARRPSCNDWDGWPRRAACLGVAITAAGRSVGRDSQTILRFFQGEVCNGLAPRRLAMIITGAAVTAAALRSSRSPEPSPERPSGFCPSRSLRGRLGGPYLAGRIFFSYAANPYRSGICLLSKGCRCCGKNLAYSQGSQAIVGPGGPAGSRR